MEKEIGAERLIPFPQEKKARVDALLAQAVRDSRRKIIVLDDDPTGVQTVHDVSVYTDWSMESIQRGFADPSRLFFILTNSRALTAAESARVHRQIIDRVIAVSTQRGVPFIIVSRSDSTLRGHYPLETEILAQGMARAAQKPDGEILCPYFAEGGRYTLDDIHYVRCGDTLVPAANTEFAQDRTFGYRHSNLKYYIQEKTGGAYRAQDVCSIALADLRALRIERVADQLRSIHDFSKVIVNATDDYDVKVFCIALYRALDSGKRFCYRTAAAFAKALGNISDKPLLTRAEMITEQTHTGGIVVVGSHTQKTTRQLAELRKCGAVVPLAMNSDLVLTEGALEEEAARIAGRCGELMLQGRTPAVFTKRTPLTVPGDTPEAALRRSVRISHALQSVIAQLTVKPAFVIAKGGITASDVGTMALRVTCAIVLGQIRPGVPVWRTDEKSRFPGIPYVIFPGNVGDDDTLREAVETLL